MRELRKGGKNKHYATDTENNELFFKLKDDFVLNLLKNEKLRELRIGFGCHYSILKGKIKVFWRYNKNRMNAPKLVFKTKDFEIETEHTDWYSIEVKKKEIEIEGKRSYGLFFIFKKSILGRYKKFIKSAESTEEAKR